MPRPCPSSAISATRCRAIRQPPISASSASIGYAPSSRQAGRPSSIPLVGLRLGGKPITDYAPDFWLISDMESDDPIGYVTSPWYSPELGTNIAMGYVPIASSTPGIQLRIRLPEEYQERPGEPVDAVVVEIPFRASVNPSARELAKAQGRDFAY